MNLIFCTFWGGRNSIPRVSGVNLNDAIEIVKERGIPRVSGGEPGVAPFELCKLIVFPRERGEPDSGTSGRDQPSDSPRERG